MSISLKLSAKPLDLPLKLVTRRLATNDSIGTAAWRNVSAAGSTTSDVVKDPWFPLVKDPSEVCPSTRVMSSYHLIPSPIDQNRWAHWRNPMDMIRQG